MAGPADAEAEEHKRAADLTEEQRRDITEHAVAQLRRRLVERLTGRGEP